MKPKRLPQRLMQMRPKRYCMKDPAAAITDEIIRREIIPGSRVIDLGCGDGRLLQLLRDEMNCVVQGVELDEEGFLESMRREIPVIKGDLDEGLQYLPDNSFDFAVLSQTLQQLRYPVELLEQILRVANRVLVVVPNFAYWKIRLQVLMFGRAPVTEELPYEWHNTPNLHLMSMQDFRELEKEREFRIVKELPIIGEKSVPRAMWANVRARTVLYILEKKDSQKSSS
ncbi:methionine biosynthesis protein MetW [uncultured Rubinisphaera sp.]|uniref:methionine biosynthesis protein MetW n=1 Tax=uncultured Rubinisphaera sp. TaxID=1678686 RepID=UPI0030DC4B66